MNKNRFTKHYFIGSKRIASRIGSGHFNNVYGMNGCNITAGQQDYAERLSQIESQKEDYYRELGIGLYLVNINSLIRDIPIKKLIYDFHHSTSDSSIDEHRIALLLLNIFLSD